MEIIDGLKANTSKGTSRVILSLLEGQPIGRVLDAPAGEGAMSRLLAKRGHDVIAFEIDEREFAAKLGAFWTGDTRDQPPRLLDSIIDTTPAWLPVLSAMENLAPGGRLVINAIRKEAGDQELLLQLNYERHLWQEKSIRSVANVTRKDVRECLRLAAQIPLQPHVTEYSLDEANAALIELKHGHIMGAKVLHLAQVP